MSAELKDTHLMEWLRDGYTHCQHGSKEWCQSYLTSAHDYILSLEAELSKAREALEPFAKDDPDKLDILEDNEMVFPRWSDLTAKSFRRAREVFRSLSKKEASE